ncbi:uncharacterized protein LOC132193754 [Neocloeon triangulifer]|uniref:uncharacterized protein LOC132193754 n=1 Tax=Neocloeon triangulifer TaxID=2078957 RepID=UPI00286F4689|nr:uncharacterized protein LOC132193754 [Neocloeon triangulifer]
MLRIANVLLPLLAVVLLAEGQRPPYQPDPWVYPKPTSEPPLPSATTPGAVQGVVRPVKRKPQKTVAALAPHTTPEQETTTLMLDLLGVKPAPQVIDRKRFRPIKDKDYGY